MTQVQLDQGRVEEFAGKMLGILNDAFLALMSSIGHQTGLFDTMGALPPSTSEKIAGAAGLNERYVREWLGAMVVAGIVEYDPAAQTYVLPKEHAVSLTRAAGTGNLANMMQWVACIGDVEQKIVECFRRGGGVPYSAYERFHRIMAQQSGQTFDATLVDRTLPLVPGLVERLRAGIDALDAGCGSGHAVSLMAKAFPKSRFTGYDFSEEGIAAGRAEADAWGLSNARFEVKDVAEIEAPGSFDFITAFDSIHDQARPAEVLRGISDALRPDGTFLMVDIAASSNLAENLDHPLGPFFYSISTMHCMTVSLALDGEGLGAVWGGQKARQMLSEAGFTQTAVHQVPGDLINNYYIATKR